MLEDYKDEQSIMFQLLVHSVLNNRYSHAYLFETKGYPYKNLVALSFAKFLLCPNQYYNQADCKNCIQCQRIDDGNFPELKIIKPEGLWIKKEQLKELQEEFSKKAIEGNKKIYIIQEAEKLNAAAANSILKFLEEPEENIVAILLTDNVHQVMETIVSRCQIVPFRTIRKCEFLNSESDFLVQQLLPYLSINILKTDDSFLSNEKINDIIYFIEVYEKKRLDVLLYMNKLWNQHINDKEKMILGLEVMILFYKDVLNYLCQHKIKIFNSHVSLIGEIKDHYTIDQLKNVIFILLQTKEKIRFNVNINLLMDDCIIKLERMKKICQ